MDSDSDDDAVDFGIEQLTKSIRNVKLDDDDADDEFENEEQEMIDEDGHDEASLTNASMAGQSTKGVSSRSIPTTLRLPKTSVGTVSSLTGVSSDEEETESEDDYNVDSDDGTVSSVSVKKTTMAASDDQETPSHCRCLWFVSLRFAAGLHR